MKRIILTIIVALAFMAPTWADAAKKYGESMTKPEVMVKSHGKIQYRYNIKATEKAVLAEEAGMKAKPQTVYSYDYIEIEPPVTKRKILDAIAASKSNTDVKNLDQERSTALTELEKISKLSYAKVDAHIDKTFPALTTAQKTSLANVYKAVLALIKLTVEE
jgi:hypothetical protein